MYVRPFVPYTFNLYNAVYQLYLNKLKKKKNCVSQSWDKQQTRENTCIMWNTRLHKQLLNSLEKDKTHWNAPRIWRKLPAKQSINGW